MTRFTDAALLKGDYAHMAAEMRAGDRAAPLQKDWDKTACDNSAEEAAQEVAKHIFAFQKSIDPEKEQLEIYTYSAAGQMKVIALHPGEGDLIRIDGMLVSKKKPASVVLHAAQMALTFLSAPLPKAKGEEDGGLKIGFVIFDELQERQKARYGPGKTRTKGKKPKKLDLSKPFGLPTSRKAAAEKSPVKKAAVKKPAVKKSAVKKSSAKPAKRKKP